MGVPALFRWLSQKYPKIITPVIEDHPREIDGEIVPVDTTTQNPNGEEFDNLYLDMNGIVHPCSHPEDKAAPANEEEMMVEVFKYTDRVVKMVRPRKLLMIAVDGVAPRAKMNQQRSRRFRSAQEAKEKDEQKAEFVKMLKQQQGGVVDDEVLATITKKTWDSNSITPGTPFMEILSISLKYWVAYKLNTDPAWEKLKIIISDASVPGEGEHKIMEFVRSQRRQQTHNPNTRHVIYGLDADLIMLGLATHEPYFRVLREDVFFQEGKQKLCQMCGQSGHRAEECKGEAKKKQGEFDEKQRGAGPKPFIWLHVTVLREYLAAELQVPNQPFKFDLERAIDDWVFMCFFVGNDFLPHLPSLDIRDNGIDILIALWRDNIPIMGGYVTKDGHVDRQRAQFILDGLTKQEDAIFKRRKQVEDRRNQNAKRRKLEQESRSNSMQSQHDRGNNSNTNPNTNQAGRGRKSSGVPSVEDLLVFNPKDMDSREVRAKEDEAFLNRKAIYQANMANKSAAAALKSQLAGKSSPETPTKEGDSTGNDDDTKASDTAEAKDSTDDNVHSAPGVTVAAGVTDTISSALGKRKAELMEDDPSTPGRNTPISNGTPKADSDEPPPDNVRLWEDGYADRYYENKFHVDAKDIDFRHKVANAYVEGLCWVLLYYFQGCPSWTWFYPYHYAPFAADFKDIGNLDVTFDAGKPFKPYEQLMGVMPAASSHTLPEVFRGLMSDEDSEIIDFYPEDFPIDLNGKKMAWQGVAILPFIDEKRLLDAMAKKYPMLTDEENGRNAMGKDTLLLSTKHPLYEEIVTSFYSKKAQTDPSASATLDLDPAISEGLHGIVDKNESYLPSSSRAFPFSSGAMPDLEDDHSISVNYDMPRSTHVHKSMILRGVQFPPPTLNGEDIQETKTRAARSGRSHGGVPFGGNDRHYRGNRNGDYRGGRGRGVYHYNYNNGGGAGRGGSGNLNYDNPFAAALGPGFDPSKIPAGGPPPPHLAAASGWMPPPPPGQFPANRGGRGGFGGPPPPPPQFIGGRGGYGGQRDYNGGYQGGGGSYGGGGYRGDGGHNDGGGGYRGNGYSGGGRRDDDRHGQGRYSGGGGGGGGGGGYGDGYRGGRRDDRRGGGGAGYQRY